MNVFSIGAGALALGEMCGGYVRVVCGYVRGAICGYMCGG